MFCIVSTMFALNTEISIKHSNPEIAPTPQKKKKKKKKRNKKSVTPSVGNGPLQRIVFLLHVHFYHRTQSFTQAHSLHLVKDYLYVQGPPHSRSTPRGSSAVVLRCASVVSYVAMFLLLFLIPPSFGALGSLCFVIVAFPGYFLPRLFVWPGNTQISHKHPRSLVRIFAGYSVGSQGSKASSGGQRRLTRLCGCTG